jgi:Secretion system C-terminal sorting domain
LPSSTTARPLNVGTLTNPSSTTYRNVLAGQALALTLTLGFDNNPNFATSSTPLGSLIVTSGTFAGSTVNQLLSIANTILGGGSSPYTASQINDALDNVNRNYDNGTVNLGYLSCPCSSSRGILRLTNTKKPELEKEISVYPNPIVTTSTFEITLNYDSNLKIELIGLNGQLIKELFNEGIDAFSTKYIDIDATSLPTGIYILKTTTNNAVYNKKIIKSGN